MYHKLNQQRNLIMEVNDKKGFELRSLRIRHLGWNSEYAKQYLSVYCSHLSSCEI